MGRPKYHTNIWKYLRFELIHKQIYLNISASLRVSTTWMKQFFCRRNMIDLIITSMETTESGTLFTHHFKLIDIAMGFENEALLPCNLWDGYFNYRGIWMKHVTQLGSWGLLFSLTAFEEHNCGIGSRENIKHTEIQQHLRTTWVQKKRFSHPDNKGIIATSLMTYNNLAAHRRHYYTN